MPTILAVDDDRSILSLLEDTLTLAGYDVVGASNGDEALAKIKRRRFDLMILDIMMPGTDGYGVLDRLPSMRNGRDMPVIVVTAKHEPHGVLAELSRGAVDHLAKPFHTLELEDAVERALDPNASHRRARQVATEAEVYGSMDILFREARSSQS